MGKKIKNVDNHNGASQKTPRIKLPIYLPYDCFNLLGDWNKAMFIIDKLHGDFFDSIAKVREDLAKLDGKTGNTFAQLYDKLASMWETTTNKFGDIDKHMDNVHKKFGLVDETLTQIGKNIVKLFNVSTENTSNIVKNANEIDSLDDRLESAENTLNDHTDKLEHSLNDVINSAELVTDDTSNKFYLSSGKNSGGILEFAKQVSETLQFILPSMASIPKDYSNVFDYLKALASDGGGGTIIQTKYYMVGNSIPVDYKIDNYNSLTNGFQRIEPAPSFTFDVSNLFKQIITDFPNMAQTGIYIKLIGYPYNTQFIETHEAYTKLEFITDLNFFIKKDSYFYLPLIFNNRAFPALGKVRSADNINIYLDIVFDCFYSYYDSLNMKKYIMFGYDNSTKIDTIVHSLELETFSQLYNTNLFIKLQENPSENQINSLINSFINETLVCEVGPLTVLNK